MWLIDKLRIYKDSSQYDGLTAHIALMIIECHSEVRHVWIKKLKNIPEELNFLYSRY